ncbi:MAG: carbohydrate ABC transporter substrate-binding protein [Anaerolineae bacterium]|nr:carbohydrate ABC transporter substrate-binding protein [Phycisphaerae bacterium]
MLLAIVSGAVIFASSQNEWADGKPDLIFATFTKEHAESYRPAIAIFEKENNCRVQLQVVDSRALTGRLQSAIQAGAEVPDMVELLDGSMGTFTKGPIKDVGFIELNDYLKRDGLDKALVSNRFVKWSSRGHIFALPHDVHPVMLAYRRDLVEDLKIDVNKLTTWDEFARVGREVTKDLDGNGVVDRYMIDLAEDGGRIGLFLMQAGGGLFDANGDVAFDSEAGVDALYFYVKQMRGNTRTAFSCGWGQNFAKSVIDGLCLFYICPDWRTKQFQLDVASMNGKMALMPLPAFKEGGIRTSTWGGTGLAFTKQCRDFELAWKLAKHLYYDERQLGARFAATNILPPLKSAWQLPEYSAPREFYSGQAIGTLYASLAPFVPEEQSSPYATAASAKFAEAFTNAKLYYEARYEKYGDAGLRDYIAAELKRTADQVRRQIKRNVFLSDTGQVK